VDLPDPRSLTLDVRARAQLTPLMTRVVVAGAISPTAYWRAGAANAAHGEPLRDG
jgi:NADPH-dependent ferric siderophore reductase